MRTSGAALLQRLFKLSEVNTRVFVCFDIKIVYFVASGEKSTGIGCVIHMKEPGWNEK